LPFNPHQTTPIKGFERNKWVFENVITNVQVLLIVKMPIAIRLSNHLSIAQTRLQQTQTAPSHAYKSPPSSPPDAGESPTTILPKTHSDASASADKIKLLLLPPKTRHFFEFSTKPPTIHLSQLPKKLLHILESSVMSTQLIVDPGTDVLFKHMPAGSLDTVRVYITSYLKSKIQATRVNIKIFDIFELTMEHCYVVRVENKAQVDAACTGKMKFVLLNPKDKKSKNHIDVDPVSPSGKSLLL
jgi:hypothetical protein